MNLYLSNFSPTRLNEKFYKTVDLPFLPFTTIGAISILNFPAFCAEKKQKKKKLQKQTLTNV